MIKVVLSYSRKTLYAGYRMKHKLQDHSTDNLNERKMLIVFKVGGQSSRSYCHIVGKRDRIRCRQETLNLKFQDLINWYN